MQPLRVANMLLPGIVFLLFAALAPPLPCAAVTIEHIYRDDAGEGFRDGTALGREERDFLAERGNDAATVGEARRNALERASSILENRLADAATIRIGVKFMIFEDQEDPNSPNECSRNPGETKVAAANPTGYGYFGNRFDEGGPNRAGLGTAYPYPLIETLSGMELNAGEPDIEIVFSRCVPYYYGFTGPTPENRINFVSIAVHEIVHGLGFFDQVEEDGSFPVRTITITETRGGETSTRQTEVESRTIYDEQTYSRTHGDLLVNLSARQRTETITSGNHLLWEGTDGGRNDCSYGRRMAELKSGSAKAPDGRPLLHAPSSYEPGSSVSHVHAETEDIMEAFFPFPENMDLTLGMLKDMGWNVSADGFPPDCEPTGITADPASGLVTTERGGEARFEVRIESRPVADVLVPLASTDPSEGVPDPPVLVFTPAGWDDPLEVTVRGVDDDLLDGSRNYSIILGAAKSADRFYDGFDPDESVSVRNDDDETSRPAPPEQPEQPGGEERAGDGGCAVASGGGAGKGAGAALGPLLAAAAVFSAFRLKNRAAAE